MSIPDEIPYNGIRVNKSEERIGFILTNRKMWLPILPVEFHEYGSYAVYHETKTPDLIEPLLNSNTGKLYPTGGKDLARLAPLSSAQAALAKFPNVGDVFYTTPEAPDVKISATLIGPALQLLGSYKIACVDLDDPGKTYARKVAKAPQDGAKLALARDRQIEVNARIFTTFKAAGALIMKSSSGNGYHIFFRYGEPCDKVVPVNGRFAFCGDLISHRKFVFITGEQIAVEWPHEVREDDEFGDADTVEQGAPVVRMFTATDRLPNLSSTSSRLLLELLASGDFIPFKSVSGHDENGAQIEVLPSEGYGRKLNLSDIEVLAGMAAKKHLVGSHTFLTTGVLPTGVTSVSWALRDAVSSLDEVTGDPLQIERIVMASEAVRRNPREGRETREDKTLRLLPDWIRKGRERNDEFRDKRQAETLALAPQALALREGMEVGQIVVGDASQSVAVGAVPFVGQIIDGDGNEVMPPVDFESVKQDLAAFRADAMRRKMDGEKVHSDALGSIIFKRAMLEADRMLTVSQADTLEHLFLDSGVHGFSDAGPGKGKKVLRDMIGEALAAIMNARKSEKWQGRLMKNEWGAPLSNEENSAVAVESMFGDKVRYDRFKDVILLGGRGLPGIVLGKDEHFDVLRQVQRSAIGMIKPLQVRAAVERIARVNQFDSLQNYLRGLVWDGTPRLDVWLRYLMGAPNTPYVSRIGRWFCIGAVARAMQPGCKMDNMLVLASTQGAGKNKALISLSGNRSLEFSDDFMTKDGKQQMRGQWFIEMAEVSSLSKRDHKAARTFITRLLDKYRKAYDVDDREYPRQFVLVGTTNYEPFLKDPSGERRYWIVDLEGVGVGGIRQDVLARNVDQLWAEAMVAFGAGEHWWPEGEADRWFLDEQVRVNERWSQKDGWELILREWLTSRGEAGGPVGKVRGAEWILQTVLERDVGQMNQSDMNRVAAIMQRLGYKNQSVWLDGGKVQGYKFVGSKVVGEWWVYEVEE
jgi:hypothetical protein